MVKIKRIGIAGQGGIGSWLSHLLFEYGVNRGQFDYVNCKITLYDNDSIDNGNLLHQNFEMKHIGKNKAQVNADRYVCDFKKQEMTVEDFKKFDLVFSCVDSMVFRKALYEYGWENPEFHWIDGRCNSTTCGVFHSGMPKEKLLSYLDDSEARGSCLLEYEKTNKISHVSPLIVASMMTQNFLNLMRGRRCATQLFTF